MSHDNLPDNWSSYSRTCSECGQRYHASGVVECACVRCDGCDERMSPDSLTTIGKGREAEVLCASCMTCPTCGEESEDERPVLCDVCQDRQCCDCRDKCADVEEAGDE